jgi:SAM-dependent methyltransferase
MSTESALQEIEKQLSCPEGTKGVEMAGVMHESNIGMTAATIADLEPDNNCTILELGHGNCGHLSLLLKDAPGAQYYGLEISPTMKAEAERLNHFLLAKHAIHFSVYDGKTIPFPDGSFDRIFTVNTIYFWSEPEKFIREIARVAKPDGFILITFADKRFMQQLPFVKERFRLYDKADLERLAKAAGLIVASIQEKTEQVKSKTGDSVERNYFVAKLRKG